MQRATFLTPLQVPSAHAAVGLVGSGRSPRRSIERRRGERLSPYPIDYKLPAPSPPPRHRFAKPGRRRATAATKLTPLGNINFAFKSSNDAVSPRNVLPHKLQVSSARTAAHKPEALAPIPLHPFTAPDPTMVEADASSPLRSPARSPPRRPRPSAAREKFELRKLRKARAAEEARQIRDEAAERAEAAERESIVGMLCEYEAAAAAPDSPRSALCRAAEAALPDAAAARELRGMLRQHCRASAAGVAASAFWPTARAARVSAPPRAPRHAAAGAELAHALGGLDDGSGGLLLVLLLLLRQRRWGWWHGGGGGVRRDRGEWGGARRRGRHRDPNGVGGGRGVARGAPLPCVRCARRGHADARAGRGRPLPRLFP